MRSRVIRGLAVTATLIAVTTTGGCGSSQSGSGKNGASEKSGKVAVLASTDVYGDLVTTIGGDAVSVTSLIDSPDQDPHSFEANASAQLAVARADVIVANGGGYDDFVGRMRTASKNTDAVLLDAVTVTGHTPAADGKLNEHVWYDLVGMKKMVTAIAATLSKAEPAGAAGIDSRAAALNRQLDALHSTETQIAHAHRGTKVAITEPVPLYLLQASGLTNATPPAFSEAVEEGTDVSPRVLSATLALFDKEDKGKVALLAYNEQTTGPQTERVQKAARAGSVPVVGFTETLPRGEHYIDWMRANLARVRAALNR